MESKSTYSWPKSKQLSSASNILIILLVFVLHSPTIYSQYFDIGESNSSPSALKGTKKIQLLQIKVHKMKFNGNKAHKEFQEVSY